MRFRKMNKAVLRGSLTAVAALLLSTAAFAQDVGGGTDPATDQVVQNWHDLNPAPGEGIAVGEPDPTVDGTATGSVGTDVATDSTGTDQTATDDVPIDPAGGGDGTVVVEPDPTDGGTVVDNSGDPAVDPGTVDGTDGIVYGTGDGTNPEVTIYSMDGGPCIACNMAGGGIPLGHSGNPSPVERTLVERVLTTTRHHSAAAALAATTPMAECLAVHPRASWICEWQNGAGN